MSLKERLSAILSRWLAWPSDGPPEGMSRYCRHDTDGDGDCWRCARKGGCLAVGGPFLTPCTYCDGKAWIYLTTCWERCLHCNADGAIKRQPVNEPAMMSPGDWIGDGAWLDDVKANPDGTLTMTRVDSAEEAIQYLSNGYPVHSYADVDFNLLLTMRDEMAQRRKENDEVLARAASETVCGVCGSRMRFFSGTLFVCAHVMDRLRKEAKEDCGQGLAGVEWIPVFYGVPVQVLPEFMFKTWDTPTEMRIDGINQARGECDRHDTGVPGDGCPGGGTGDSAGPDCGSGGD